MNARIRKDLLALQDPQYKDFQSKLIPNIDPEKIIGIRMPQLRKYAKQLCRDYTLFLEDLPHRYYDENNLHGIILSGLTDPNAVILELNKFLPYVDNWATCDLISPKSFRKNPESLIPAVQSWLHSDHPYTVRFGIGVLMKYYLDDCFDTMYLDIISAIRRDEYYVNMMIAWYLATALAKQYDATIPYFATHKLSKWTHNKAIQKAIESYRISSEHKDYLRNLRIK